MIVHIFSWGGMGGSRLLNGKGDLELWGLQTRSKPTCCPGQMRLYCSSGRQISIQGKFFCWILCLDFITLILGSVQPSESQYLQLLGFFTPYHPKTGGQIRGKFYSCPGRYGLDSYQRRQVCSNNLSLIFCQTLQQCFNSSSHFFSAQNK